MISFCPTKRRPTSSFVLSAPRSSNTPNPLLCVTTATPEKPGCWSLHDPGDDAPNTGGVTGDDPNWGGPEPRHNGRSAIALLDGHIDSHEAIDMVLEPHTLAAANSGGP